MKVLQFAFSTDLKNKFLPKNFNKNCVCYTGTHDNNTTSGWFEKADKKEKLLFSRLVPQVTNSPVYNLFENTNNEISALRKEKIFIDDEFSQLVFDNEILKDFAKELRRNYLSEKLNSKYYETFRPELFEFLEKVGLNGFLENIEYFIKKGTEEESTEDRPIWKLLLFVIAGGVVVVWGANISVDAATAIATTEPSTYYGAS